MPAMLVTAAVFQLPIAWLNALARLNMLYMSVTAAVSQSPIDWLNALASENMEFMPFTLAVSQSPIDWLTRWRRGTWHSCWSQPPCPTCRCPG